MASDRTKRELNEMKKTSSSPFLAWYVQWRGEIEFRKRRSNFSLDFPAIGPSVSGEAISKVASHNKGYAWAPVLGSFNKLRKVGVFSLFFV